MARITQPKTHVLITTVLAGLLLAVLPVYADDTVGIQLKPDEDAGFHPEIINGLITSDYPTVGVILEGTRESNYQFCTGTLIGCNTFLTAAHCLCLNLEFCEGHDVSTGFVYFANGGVYGVSAVDIHPDFSFPTADVAVVTLSEPVTGITPTPINDLAPVGLGTRGTIVGYGASDTLQYKQGVKRYGSVTTASCEAPISDETSVCWEFREPVGDPGEDSNTCFGDSGGPLFVDIAAPGSSELTTVVAGITSGGFNACQPDDLSFDASVYAYRQFIQDIAGDDLGTGSCGDLPPVGSAETLVASDSGELGLFENVAVHEFEVPPDLELLRVAMNAGDGNLQAFWLAVNHGSPSEESDAHCVYTSASNYFVCEFEDPVAGLWYATVRSARGIAEYQVTATMFGNRPNSGEVRIEIAPATQGVSPGGDLPYTVEVRNITGEFQNASPQWRIQSASGGEFLFGPYDIPLAPGEAWTHQGRVGFSSGVMPGPWNMIIETTGEDGAYDRDWTSFSVQTEHAVAVRLSSSEAIVRPGDEWPYTAELQNVLGRPLNASATWTITDPAGDEATYGPYDIFLAAGETWRRDLTLGYFPEGPVGVWTVTVETTAEGFVDRDSLQVELLPAGLATFRRFEDVWCIHAMNPDGSIMVGNAQYLAGGYVWTEETGFVPLEDPQAGANDLSDDGSVIMGHTVYHGPDRSWWTAATWTEETGWQDLPWMSEPRSCGMTLNHGYGISGDGTTVVGLAWDDHCHACAFRWTAETSMQCLPVAADNWGSRANTVSADGMIVMGWDSQEDTRWRRAAMWHADDPSDPFTSFTETLPGSPWHPSDPDNGAGEVLAMTPDGLVAAGDTGWGSEIDIAGGFHWSAADGFQDMEALQDNWGTWPDAMTDDGQVVVGTTGDPRFPVRTAFIWTEETGTIPLEERVTSLGADIGDLSHLAFATDITADGSTISGCTPGQGSWLFTGPGGEVTPAVLQRAGTGEVVVSDGVPVRLPAGGKLPVVVLPEEPRGEVDEAEQSIGPVQIQQK